MFVCVGWCAPRWGVHVFVRTCVCECVFQYSRQHQQRQQQQFSAARLEDDSHPSTVSRTQSICMYACSLHRSIEPLLPGSIQLPKLCSLLTDFHLTVGGNLISEQ